jgi:hypothetical protein
MDRISGGNRPGPCGCLFAARQTAADVASARVAGSASSNFTMQSRLIDERFYIDARKRAGVNGHNPSNFEPDEAATGVIVGTAKISECRDENGHYEWHLSDVKRLDKPRKPKRMPQSVWFKSF